MPAVAQFPCVENPSDVSLLDHVLKMEHLPTTRPLARGSGGDRIPHRKMGKYLRFLENEVENWFKNLPGI